MHLQGASCTRRRWAGSAARRQLQSCSARRHTRRPRPCCCSHRRSRRIASRLPTLARSGRSSAPVFSPDGNRIAYTANVNGNDDVFVVPAGGGQPSRLTWHPDHDAAVGWTPDGKNVLIRSHRDATNDSDQLYVMPMTGGLPTALPLSMAEQGSFSPDGSHIAYNPVGQWEPDWRDYHGGQTTRIWIARLSDSSIVKLPHANANDSDPMWMGDTVYFLSDRDGPATLYAYAVGSGKLTRLIDNHGFPIDDASAADGTIVYSQMGVLHLY